jgi:hypothetical protein
MGTVLVGGIRAEDAAYTADRRRLRRSLVILCVAVVAVLVVAMSAIFTDEATVPGNTFSTGEVSISTSPTTSLVTMSDMVPGDEVTSPLTVSNDGTIELRYAAVSTTTEDVLAAELDLTIKTGVTTCSNADFDTDGTVIYGPAALGSVAGVNVIGDPTQGAQAGDRVLAAAASEVLCFNVLLPASAGDAIAGLTTTATFTFSAEQTTNNP